MHFMVLSFLNLLYINAHLHIKGKSPQIETTFTNKNLEKQNNYGKSTLSIACTTPLDACTSTAIILETLALASVIVAPEVGV